MSHTSDVWRADIMLKYGGIYVDSDAIFVRPLSTELRAYDAVVAYSSRTIPPFPNIVNLGVTIGKPGTRFWDLCVVS